MESGNDFKFQKDNKKLRMEFVETRDEVDILHSIRLGAWARDRKEEGSPWCNTELINYEEYRFDRKIN